MALARARVAKTSTIQPLDTAEPEPFGPLPYQVDGYTEAERAVVNALTAWFASTRAVPGQELPYRLIAELMELGIPQRAAVEAGRLAMPPPLTGRTRHGSPGPLDDMTAARRVAWREPGFRARFLLNSARRLTEAITEDRLDTQLDLERRWRDAHVTMGRRRRQAARQADQVAQDSHSGWLVWRTGGPDPCGTCASLAGRLFTRDNPPDGTYPGAVHPACRCRAESWAGARPGV